MPKKNIIRKKGGATLIPINAIQASLGICSIIFDCFGYPDSILEPIDFKVSIYFLRPSNADSNIGYVLGVTEDFGSALEFTSTWKELQKNDAIWVFMAPLVNSHKRSTKIIFRLILA
jgi:hypothetical protein